MVQSTPPKLSADHWPEYKPQTKASVDQEFRCHYNHTESLQQLCRSVNRSWYYQSVQDHMHDP
jgi:hypothetical protein